MSRSVNSIIGVVASQLCTGCGVCAYVEPKRFRMADTLEYGRRPFLCDAAVPETGEALAVCPGARLEHTLPMKTREGVLPDYLDAWGPVLNVWEGYATDPEIRLTGSSGGIATALAYYCIEKEKMSGVLHVGARDNIPYLNETAYSTSRAELLARAGSRYAPTSPCDGLSRIEEGARASVFVGKPCDVAAVQSARRLRPFLDEKLGLVVAFFCAGVPSTKGTLDLLKANSVEDLSTIKELRYRGNGWPGMWKTRFNNRQGKEEVRQLSYSESWKFLQKYRQWRCYICPDHTGEFADISVGDPWYRQVQPGEPGKSLIVARTQRGLYALKAAQEAGYIVLEANDPGLLPRSQPNLLAARGELWARLKVLRMLGAKVPHYSGFSLFRYWLSELGTVAKLRSITGTAKRVFTKKLNKTIDIDEWKTDGK
jgi:coenzyme F420 hydrogenase subunit beta